MRGWLPYFQLCRIPAVFSAIADICLGYLLTHRPPATFTVPRDFAWLVLSSCGLYLAGMVLNDVFDRDIDAKERPFRPIPSGRVPLSSAIKLACGLLVVGNIAAGLAGLSSLWVALLLTACILAYDGGGKRTFAGPALMGSCRALNILLGASGGLPFDQVWTLPQLHVAVALGIYIDGVTIFAKQEAEQSNPLKLLLGMLILNFGLALLAAFMWNVPGERRDLTPLILLAVIVLTINRGTSAALFDPSPRRVQSAVKTMLMSLITLDAAVIFHVTNSPALTFGVIALLIPGFWLGRYMSIT